ncbi:THUMP domain-containing protein [Chitinibacteraceae bacterium HSL-7]
MTRKTLTLKKPAESATESTSRPQERRGAPPRGNTPRPQSPAAPRGPRPDGQGAPAQSRGPRNEMQGQRGARPERDAAPRRLPRKVIDWSATQQCFAPCPRGLEQLLAGEMVAAGADQVRVTDGGVSFTADWPVIYRANLCSRIASRVLVRLDERAYRNEDDIYRMASRIDWPALFGVGKTIKVSATAQRSPLRSVDFVALKVKDAVCDVFREVTGGRPSVDTQCPDIRLQLYLNDRAATLYLDTSGEGLFKRGYRVAAGDAPLRENLAAGMLMLAGWDGSEALLDPMCGSGTFAIEAAWLAMNRAPGLNRRFAFEELAGFDAARWHQVREAVAAAQRPLAVPIYASDRDLAAVDIALRNIEAAGLKGQIDVAVRDALNTIAPAEHGVLITNPPYGVRLEDQERLAEFYPQLAATFKRALAGWRVYLFTADLRAPSLMRLTPSRRTPLYNGALECRLYQFEMVAGSNRRIKAE